MKTIFYSLSLAAILLSSCGNDNSSKQNTELVEPEMHTELYGTYVGYLELPEEVEIDDKDTYEAPVKISISLTHITAKGVTGKSVIEGADRPLAGQMSTSNDKSTYTFVMKSPGGHKNDGQLEFYVQGDSLNGTWKAYDNKLKYPVKIFSLVKKPFQYDPNLMLPDDMEYVDWENAKQESSLYKNEDGTTETLMMEVFRSASDMVYKLNASTQKLTEGQLKNLKKLDLEILRNTIFARHGYSFKKKGVRQFFNYVEWYVPVSDNVDAQLTPLEKENIALLQKFEKYAEDNYDSFGR